MVRSAFFLLLNFYSELTRNRELAACLAEWTCLLDGRKFMALHPLSGAFRKDWKTFLMTFQIRLDFALLSAFNCFWPAAFLQPFPVWYWQYLLLFAYQDADILNIANQNRQRELREPFFIGKRSVDGSWAENFRFGSPGGLSLSWVVAGRETQSLLSYYHSNANRLNARCSESELLTEMRVVKGSFWLQTLEPFQQKNRTCFELLDCFSVWTD